MKKFSHCLIGAVCVDSLSPCCYLSVFSFWCRTLLIRFPYTSLTDLMAASPLVLPCHAEPQIQFDKFLQLHTHTHTTLLTHPVFLPGGSQRQRGWDFMLDLPLTALRAPSTPALILLTYLVKPERATYNTYASAGRQTHTHTSQTHTSASHICRLPVFSSLGPTRPGPGRLEREALILNIVF